MRPEKLHPKELIERLEAAGLQVSLTAEDALFVKPVSGITDELRQAIRANKSPLVVYLKSEAANDETRTKRRDDQDGGDSWQRIPDSAEGENVGCNLRVELFVRRGMALTAARSMAIKLSTRDAEYDDRVVCWECAHLSTRGRPRCRNAQVADVAPEQLAPELLSMLQRCCGFRPVLDAFVQGD